MPEPVLVAIITVGGMLGVGVVTAATQFFVTRSVIRAEYAKVRLQVIDESAARRRERVIERLTEAVAEFLTVTDPEINEVVHYQRAVVLIHKLQLLLDRDAEPERSLNGALNEMSLALQRLLSVEAEDARGGLQVRGEVMAVHGRIIDLAHAVINERAAAV